jgi:hypothetical protein
LEKVEVLENITTAYFLGVFPLRANELIHKTLCECKKIIYIDHRECNIRNYQDFRKQSEILAGAIKIKFIDVLENAATAQISLKYFKEKAKNKKLIIDQFNPLFPNYVKKTHNQVSSPQVFEAFVKLISESEMSCDLKYAEIVSCLSEKVSGYLNSCGMSLKMLWKILTLKIERIKAKASLKHSKVLNKCQTLVEEWVRNLQISENNVNLNCIALYKVPIYYYKFRNLIQDLVMAKAVALKMKQICLISWISYKSNKKLLITVHSNDSSFKCKDLAMSYGVEEGEKHAEFMIRRKEFDLWKFNQIGK